MSGRSYPSALPSLDVTKSLASLRTQTTCTKLLHLDSCSVHVAPEHLDARNILGNLGFCHRRASTARKGCRRAQALASACAL